MGMVRHNLFIVNDYSSHHIDLTEMKALADSIFDSDVDFAHIGGRNDYKDMIRDAGESGEPVRVYACGGDGTLNSVLQEVMGYGNLSLTNVALGTGNDYLKRFDRPSAFHDLEEFSKTFESKVDVIRLNDLYSANVVCFGLDARVCEVYEKLRPIKIIGKMGYQIGCLVSIIKGVSQSCRVELDDGAVFDGKMTLVCVCNNGWYGGSYHPSPEANVKDGLLDVIVCRKISRLTMIRILSKYKKGMRHKISSKIIEHHRVRSMRIIPDEVSPFNLDGELVMAPEANISVEHEALRFFYPESVKEIDP